MIKRKEAEVHVQGEVNVVLAEFSVIVLSFLEHGVSRDVLLECFDMAEKEHDSRNGGGKSDE